MILGFKSDLVEMRLNCR